MTIYDIQFSASAAKEFRALSSDVKLRISPIIDNLADNPYPSGIRKLKGHKHLYRIRVRDYRVVYEIHNETLIVRIVRIRHRKDVYR